MLQLKYTVGDNLSCCFFWICIVVPRCSARIRRRISSSEYNELLGNPPTHSASCFALLSPITTNSYTQSEINSSSFPDSVSNVAPTPFVTTTIRLEYFFVPTRRSTCLLAASTPMPRSALFSLDPFPGTRQPSFPATLLYMVRVTLSNPNNIVTFAHPPYSLYCSLSVPSVPTRNIENSSLFFPSLIKAPSKSTHSSCPAFKHESYRPCARSMPEHTSSTTTSAFFIFLCTFV
mmetsp:Transcript_1788/g.2693  ORF Transcript_1788/g.2693 Transcript_1788/m.2693 type:complete len:233 (-) Transcript_1788:42-740(-)